MGSYGQAGTTITGSPPACRVFNSAAFSIAHNVDSVVSFDSERWDTDNMHSTVTNTSRITINTPGIYNFIFTCQIATATDYTVLYCYIRANGSNIIGIGPGYAGSGGVADPLASSAMFKMATGDYVEALVRQANGAAAARNLLQSASYTPEFGATWMGLGT